MKLNFKIFFIYIFQNLNFNLVYCTLIKYNTQCPWSYVELKEIKFSRQVRKNYFETCSKTKNEGWKKKLIMFEGYFFSLPYIDVLFFNRECIVYFIGRFWCCHVHILFTRQKIIYCVSYHCFWIFFSVNYFKQFTKFFKIITVY